MTLAQFLQIILASVSCTDIPTSFPIYHSHYSHHLPSYCRARSRPRNSSSSHNHGPARIPLVCPYVNNRRAQVSFLPATPRQVLKRSNPSLSHSCPTFFLTSFHPGRPFFLPLFSALLPRIAFATRNIITQRAATDSDTRAQHHPLLPPFHQSQ